MRFDQKNLFCKRSYEYDRSILTVTTWDLFTGLKKWTLRLDEISHRYEARTFTSPYNGCLIYFLIFSLAAFLILNISWVVSLIVGVVAVTPLILGRFVNYFNYFEIQTKRGPLLIRQNRFNKVQAEAFITGLIQASKQYLIWRYGTIDPDYSREKQIENFRWLRNNDIISDEEYDNLKARLNEVLKKT